MSNGMSRGCLFLPRLLYDVTKKTFCLLDLPRSDLEQLNSNLWLHFSNELMGVRRLTCNHLFVVFDELYVFVSVEKMHTFCNHLHTPFKHCLYFTTSKIYIFHKIISCIFIFD